MPSEGAVIRVLIEYDSSMFYGKTFWRTSHDSSRFGGQDE